MTRRVPISILSGYLGAGKTTIINHVLAEPHGRRLAVLVNDFGPINIDAGLIGSQSAATIELTNGCVCCTIGDDMGDALTDLTAWPEPPDNVLVEASGVAEPARIARTAGYWPGFELDAVIVAADAETVQARSRDKFVGTLVHSQRRSADIIALTKTDLVEEQTLDDLRRWLACQAPQASRIACRAGFCSGARATAWHPMRAPTGITIPITRRHAGGPAVRSIWRCSATVWRLCRRPCTAQRAW